MGGYRGPGRRETLYRNTLLGEAAPSASTSPEVRCSGWRGILGEITTAVVAGSVVDAYPAVRAARIPQTEAHGPDLAPGSEPVRPQQLVVCR